MYVYMYVFQQYMYLFCVQSEDGPQNAKRPRSLVQNTLEECDTTEEDAVLFVLEEDGSVSQRVCWTSGAGIHIMAQFVA